MKKFSIVIWFVFIFFSCGTTDKADSDKSMKKDTPMAEYADNSDFKQAHDVPARLKVAAQGRMMSIAVKDSDSTSVYIPAEHKEGKPFLFVIHEWWGLNEHIKREADRYYRALDSINVLALDLYDGEVAETRDEASSLVKKDRTDRINAIFDAVYAYVGDAAVGTIGWCYGGGYSLRAAIQGGEQVEACVMFYGSPVNKQEKLAHLQAPVLAIWAENDKHLTPEVAAEFRQSMKEAGKTYSQEMYDADHAFANPSSASYTEKAAKDATTRAIEFLRKHLLDKE